MAEVIWFRPTNGRDTPANHRQSAIIAGNSMPGWKGALTDADERAPDGGKAGADKHQQRVVAECAAISADISAK